MEQLSEHILEEEKHDMPLLESKLSQDESEAMTKSFGRTKMFLPTRSHPSAPSKPPFETVASLMAAPIDLLSDMFRKFPEDKSSRESGLGRK
jgi:hypothetical protein